ncbi:transmembrane GTPase Marf [Capsaspora owczarzaki ATCC 30864]|uniref:Transmembrane GTPase Marf n=1 Tax=Capsaspora owczarzaki (strain ATCC 30864) TaxID=595528 RepID=A0A0D2X0Q9_CAPO3|nr:transmembrane GTPase Marf [Capsaspora owczarzaki ATCC 30864]KJE89489.1 transmembrane GTPase Marf [Capsaspora owczarzaki ATCC 30864]|eukprot:XP_004365821.1 transmembrane GTPase Marf [Capsaspora owczarzaki ATCC 30864]
MASTNGGAKHANGHAAATPVRGSASSLQRAESLDTPVSRRLREEVQSQSAPSPLRKFRVGKLQISALFDRLRTLLSDCSAFLAATHIEADDFMKEQKEIGVFSSQVSSISKLFERDHMKVVFVGQTSNGKSTVVNAMLYNRILPSGIGHTTNCFVSVSGSDANTPYIIDSLSSEQQPISNVLQLANALHPEGSLNQSGLIRVFWPTTKCRLLGDDVDLIDSPGLDLSNDINQWIDDYCMDADVFVLVANAEATLKVAERAFFFKVNEKLSKPNVFILNNRWDASDNEIDDSPERVREQHLEYASKFLADELKVVSRSKILDRVFFVSARETLLYRTTENWTRFKESQAVRDRYDEFRRFEQAFERTICKSAMKTKFEHRIVRGLDIAYSLAEIAGKAETLSKEQISGRIKEINERKENAARIRQLGERSLKCCSALVDRLAATSRASVARAMNEEIDHVLPHIVAEFSYSQFRPQHLLQYKRMLNDHIEGHLGSDLNKKCAARLIMAFDETKSEMQRIVANVLVVPDASSSSMLANGASALLETLNNGTTTSAAEDAELESLAVPADVVIPAILKAIQTQSISTNGSLIEFNLDCKGLSDNFEEDIAFRFSLGWHTVGPKLLGPRLYPAFSVVISAVASKFSIASGFANARQQNMRSAAALASGSPTPAAGTIARTASYVSVHTAQFNGDAAAGSASELALAASASQDAVASSSVTAEAALTLADRVGLVLSTPSSYAVVTILATLVTRPGVWKLAALSGAAFGSLYLYEYALYTNGAKERRFKEQFTRHAASELRRSVRQTSHTVSISLQSRLSFYVDELRNAVRQTEATLTAEIARAEREVAMMQDAISKAGLLHHEALSIRKGLADAQETFIDAEQSSSSGHEEA